VGEITCGTARIAGRRAERTGMITLRPVPSIQEGLLPQSFNERLGRLHDRYVEAVNLAVAEADLGRVDRLATEFDRDVAKAFHPAS
jgi:hypothetical protein